MGGVASAVSDAVGFVGGIARPKMDAAAPPPPTPSPTGTDAANTNAAMDAAAEEQKKAQGRASTVLTGGAGDTSQATTSKRVLLGS